MSYVRVETSVPRHPKFLRAGPAACWLWLCGLAYCQDALTDGFIATEALCTLGVVKPLPLVTVLVREGLWHQLDSGWRIHDYLEHNNSAAYVQKVRADRRESGRRGGRPRKPDGLTPGNQFAFRLLNHQAKQPENPATATATTVQTATAVPVEQEHAPRRALPAIDMRMLVMDYRRQRSRETTDGRPALRVITAIARHVLIAHPDLDDGELSERVKYACARANLEYACAVGPAIDRARAQLSRQSRRAS